MNKKLKNLSLVIGIIFFCNLNAQELKSLALQNSINSIQAETVLLINYQPVEPNYCGLHVEWGDGEGQDVRIEKAANEPMKISKKYNRAGDYTVVVKGKLLIRGLKTAIPCKGATLTIPVKVIDQEQIRQKNEIEKVSESLKTEASKRQELELMLQAEKLKQQELLLKQREEEILRQKIQLEIEAQKQKEEAAKKSQADKKNDLTPTPSRRIY